MKSILKILASLFLILFVVMGIAFFMYNEPIPTGKEGPKADLLAHKMLKALNKEAFDKVEIIEWSFRDTHYYKWLKQEGKVYVSWDSKQVILNLEDHSKSIGETQELRNKALEFFNNDSFWLVAPYKVFDKGTTRSIVTHNNKDALLVTYLEGGTTPGDSYLWILDENGLPLSYKMWVSIIPFGGLEASWNHYTSTKAGFKLPTHHIVSPFDLKIDMGTVRAFNPKANKIADDILKAINHDAYIKTNYLEWSFAGKRFYKWNKKQHIVDVSWDSIRVNLHPNQMENSHVFIHNKPVKKNSKLIKRAWDLFNNDSFWLVAPHKIYDDGVIRTVVNIENKEALNVKYTSGGTTPGDSYTWILDSLNVPKKYYMYVPSMNLKGVSATWEQWDTTATGTLLPKMHTFISGNKLSMGKVKTYY